jgi:2-polyprenyl-6-methoxyphenol hydroxylase-like FAD-dependent oxidoreductase
LGSSFGRDKPFHMRGGRSAPDSVTLSWCSQYAAQLQRRETVDYRPESSKQVREGCSLVELTGDGARVTGARLQDRSTRHTLTHTVTESAALVVGADGKHSTVARQVRAAERRRSAAATFACYAYWDGLPVKGGEIYSGKGSAIGAWPTNDGLTLTYVAGPISDFDHVRRNPTELAALVSEPEPPFRSVPPELRVTYPTSSARHTDRDGHSLATRAWSWIPLPAMASAMLFAMPNCCQQQLLAASVAQPT